MDPLHPTLRGRGVATNPASRFDALRFEFDPDLSPDERPSPQTLFLRDTARTIIARNDSPDIPFSASINPYRGCEHGCSYCFARPTHNYLGYSAGVDFETRILVKTDAPDLLRKELAAPRYQPEVLSISGVTDCYQPVERKLELTRRCLAVLAECRHPVTLVTKNHLVTRDADLLADLARHDCACVLLSLTTLDPDLSAKMEPRASAPRRRLAAIEALAAAGIPAGVMIAPVIPGLTDHEIPAILAAAKDAGATCAGFVPLRLPLDVAPLFEDWLARHFPDRRDKVLNRVRSMRDGRLNDPNFGTRLQGHGPLADQLHTLFSLSARRTGLDQPFPSLTTAHFRPPQGPQLSLFD